MKRLMSLVIGAALGCAGCAGMQSIATRALEATLPDKAQSVHDVGFATPESVLYDAQADIYLVSNINGNPTGQDDNGFISRLKPDGTIEELKWIDGEREEYTLHAPKGMGLVGDTLYVTDIDHIRSFDRNTGMFKGELHFNRATFLNDIAPNGHGGIVVSDSGFNPDFSASGTDSIYSIDGTGKIVTVIKGVSLNRPNGLAVANDEIWNVSFGSKEIRRMSMDGKVLERFEAPGDGLDGIEVLKDGRAIISSWGGKSVYMLNKDGTFKDIIVDVDAAADIGFDTRRNRVLVPLFNENIVRIEPLS